MTGIIPEMSKEPKSLDTFLAPIVDELQALWKGVKLTTSQSRIPLTYQGALLLASADLPAVRKLCGFKGHSGAVQNASNISQEPSMKKQTTLVLIAVIVCMQRWWKSFNPK